MPPWDMRVPYTGCGPFAFLGSDDYQPYRWTTIEFNGKKLHLDMMSDSCQWRSVVRNFEIATGHKLLTTYEVTRLIDDHYPEQAGRFWHACLHTTELRPLWNGRESLYHLRTMVRLIRQILGKPPKCRVCGKKFSQWASSEKSHRTYMPGFCSEKCREWRRFSKSYPTENQYQEVKDAFEAWFSQRVAVDKLKSAVYGLREATKELGSWTYPTNTY